MTSAAHISLVMVGEPEAAACTGDVCEGPEHLSQVLVNRKLDEDAV